MVLICLIVGLIVMLIMLRAKFIADFKISYYETKLKNRDVDISHIENITLKGIFRQQQQIRQNETMNDKPITLEDSLSFLKLGEKGKKAVKK